MSEISASEFPTLYGALGIDTTKLGCIMLNTKKISVTKLVGPGSEDDLYDSDEWQHAGGAVAENEPHVTLLYGLLTSPMQTKFAVDTVLEGWKMPKTLTIEKVGFFPGDGFSTIVGHIKMSDELFEGHQRLQLLPHVDTYPTYKPHITLAYVKEEATTEWIEALRKIAGKDLTVHPELNYGK